MRSPGETDKSERVGRHEDFGVLCQASPPQPARVFRPPAELPPHAALARLLFVAKLSDARKGSAYLLEAYGRRLAQGVPVPLDVLGAASGARPPTRPGIHDHGPLPLSGLVERYQPTLERPA